MREIDNYFEKQKEPAKGCLIALRVLIMQSNRHMTEAWKYGMPCFCYHGKMMYYLWTDKKTSNPYVLFVEGKKIEHPLLEKGNRSRMKIFNINPNLDLPLEDLTYLMAASEMVFNKKLKIK